VLLEDPIRRPAGRRPTGIRWGCSPDLRESAARGRGCGWAAPPTTRSQCQIIDRRNPGNGKAAVRPWARTAADGRPVTGADLARGTASATVTESERGRRTLQRNPPDPGHRGEHRVSSRIVLLRQCVLAASVLGDLDIDPRDEGVVLPGTPPVMVPWAHLD